LGLSLTPQVEEEVQGGKPAQQEETADLAVGDLEENQPVE